MFQKLCLLLVVLCMLPLFSQETDVKTEKFCFLSMLPAEPFLVVGCPDFNAVKQASMNLGITNLAKEKEVILFVESFEPFLKDVEKLFRLPEVFGYQLTLEDLQKLEISQVFFSILDIDLESENPIVAAYLGNPSIGQSLLDIWKQKEYLIEYEVDGIKLAELKNTGLFAYIVPSHGLVVCNNKESLLDLIAAKSPRFTTNTAAFNAFKNLVPEGETCVLGAYGNAQRLFKFVEQTEENDREVLQVLDGLRKTGVLSIQGLGASINFAGTDIKTRLFLHDANPNSTFHKLYDGDKVDVKSIAGKIPAHALGVHANNFDIIKFLDQLQEFVRVLDLPESVERDLMRGFDAELSGRLENKIQDFFWKSFKREFSESFSFPMTSFFVYCNQGLIPERIIMLPVKSQNKAERFVTDLLETFMELEVKVYPDSNKQNPRIHYLASPVTSIFDRYGDSLGEIICIGLSGRAFMFYDNCFYLATSVQTLKEYVSWKNGNGPSLDQNPIFQAYTNTLPEKTRAFLYLEYADPLERCWDTVNGIVHQFEGIMRRFGVPIETNLIPSSKTISKHIAHYRCSIASTSDGFLVTLSSPLEIVGMSALSFIGAGIMELLQDLRFPTTTPDYSETKTYAPKDPFEDNNPTHRIFTAIEEGNVDMVEFLLATENSVNAVDEVQNTPLIHASLQGQLKMVELILQAGPEVNAQNMYGNTALMLAADRGHSEIVKLLITHSADVNLKSSDKQTALIFAAANGFPDVARILLDNGAEVNAAGYEGNTPLIYAARSGSLDIVKMLLEKGAEINSQNGYGSTALRYAQANEHQEIIAFLLANGAKEDVSSSDDQTPVDDDDDADDDDNNDDDVDDENDPLEENFDEE